MVECFLQSKAVIKDVVETKKPELLNEVSKIYDDCENMFKDYCKVVSPIKKRIADLEVIFVLLLLLTLNTLGRQVCNNFALSAIILVVVSSLEQAF